MGIASGSIYYTDACNFFDNNEALINELIIETHQEGYEEGPILEMLTSFGRGSDLEVEFSEFTYGGAYDEYTEEVEFSNEVVWVMSDFVNCVQRG